LVSHYGCGVLFHITWFSSISLALLGHLACLHGSNICLGERWAVESIIPKGWIALLHGANHTLPKSEENQSLFGKTAVSRH